MEPEKKMGFLKRAKTKTAIQINSVMALVVRTLLAKYLSHQKLEKLDLTGKNAIITGSNTGLGKAMATHLAEMNATIYLVCRNLEKAEVAKADILKSAPNATIHLLQLDTSTLENCRKFCEKWETDGGKPIDILMHNAGVGSAPTREQTFGPDGFEYLYMTNLLSNILMTYMLEKFFAPNARVIMTSSPGCYVGGISSQFETQSTKQSIEKGFNYPDGQKPQNSILYSNTKLMQLCFAKNLMRKWKLEGKDYVAHAYNPGYAASEFFNKDGVHDTKRKMDPIWWILKNGVNLAMPSSEGCKTGVMLATSQSKKVAATGGRLWERMKTRTCIIDLYDNKLLDKLWTRWCLDVGIQWDLIPKELLSEGSVDGGSTIATMEK
ncbi:hypothetical protein H072_10421 [Dactylellina haptotyla CBS 200.50]|uniref:Uncharacterized protein n=1 Tax=Dactylellina haptotyla (strain CBS 200.50) TaxID=1284197 RepID=S8BA99_DACHA|nr:hypothetical protein H072_10421 [Dactylellina haptotyla CBS 200.50]